MKCKKDLNGVSKTELGKVVVGQYGRLCCSKVCADKTVITLITVITLTIITLITLITLIALITLITLITP